MPEAVIGGQNHVSGYLQHRDIASPSTIYKIAGVRRRNGYWRRQTVSTKEFDFIPPSLSGVEIVKMNDRKAVDAGSAERHRRECHRSINIIVHSLVRPVEQQ